MTATNAFFGSDDDATVGNAEAEPELVRPLTRRESQVVDLLDKGLTPKEIAFELGVAPSTVRVLIARAAQKGVRPRPR